jgi:hypothetical protein
MMISQLVYKKCHYRISTRELLVTNGFSLDFVLNNARRLRFSILRR